ncbi:MAG: plastocyanin/azurin family copper-binding protein [bacterium]
MLKNFKPFLIVLLCTVFTTAALPAWAGTIAGTIEVKGLRSPQEVVIYITKDADQAEDVSGARFAVDQSNLSFLPHVLLVPQGATVQFPNNDKVPHNVFSLSQTKKFNLGNYGPGASKSIVFDQPGLVELRCDMHAEMSAYILVMKNSYFGMTDKAGEFSIPDTRYLKSHGIASISEIPAGKYTIRTWHEKLKSVSKTVDVPVSGTVTLELTLKRGTPGALYKR